MQSIEDANTITLLQEPWSEEEGKQFWTGYEDFLDRISTVSDDERTVAIQVLA